VLAGRKWGGVASAIAILVVYLGSVVGYFWLDSSATEVEPVSLERSGETVVLVELTAIRPVEDSLTATVLVLPDRALLDETGALKTDLAVRMYPSNDFDQLCYLRGHVPGREQTTLHLFGDADRWPFDRFATGTLSADAFIGSCGSGMWEDLVTAASILKGRRLAPNVRLFVAPGSEATNRRLASEGLLGVFIEAGAVMLPPGCGPCNDAVIGPVHSGEVSMSTATNNNAGRFGAKDAQLYLGSPATVAASAVAGKITDARKLN
jgi:hypothetical protein